MEEQVEATSKDQKITKKIFINNLDSYHGRAIVEVCFLFK